MQKVLQSAKCQKFYKKSSMEKVLYKSSIESCTRKLRKRAVGQHTNVWPQRAVGPNRKHPKEKDLCLYIWTVEEKQ